MLSCGCVPTLEGGYGDGTQSRYYMESWCATHAAAPEMLAFIRTVESVATTGMNDADRADLRRRARAFLAKIDGQEAAS